MKKNIDLLSDLLAQIKEIPLLDDTKLDACIQRADMLIRNIFKENTHYLERLHQIRFYPFAVYAGMSKEKYITPWKEGISQFENLIQTMMEEISVFGSSQGKSNELTAVNEQEVLNESIFIVHGHDDEMKQSVARLLEKLGLAPIILHEQPNDGRTIIEKLLDYSNSTSYAIVLLSPDDIAYKRDEKPDQAKFRSRQNVILELGFFIGKLGRTRVTTLFKQDETIELPSDFSGVLYTPFDNLGKWQFELVRELKSVGYDLDANKLFPA